MAKEARHHHYLPQCYLAGFTESGEKTDLLYVFEVESDRSFRTSPRNVGAERDFNRVEIDGTEPDAIEKALALFEGQAANVLKRTTDTNVIHSTDDFVMLLNLVGLLSVRNPQIRNAFNQAREALLRRVGEALVSNQSIWDHHVEKALDAGEQLPASVKYEDVKGRRGSHLNY